MIGSLLKSSGSFIFATSLLKELHDWYEYTKNPTPENKQKAIEISSRSQFMASIGIIMFFLGYILEKKD